MKKTLLTISTVIASGIAMAQVPGDLDLTFGIGGYSTFDPYANTGEIYWDMITLSNDKIVKVGYTNDGGDSDILIARFLPDGTPDSTFNATGYVKADMTIGGNEDARGVCEIANGQLLVTGYMQGVGALNAFVARVNEDGSLDTSFGTNGYTLMNAGDNLIAYGKSVVYDAVNNEIYVGGAAMNNGQGDIFLCNLTMGGGIDNSFSSNGYALLDIEGGEDQLMKMDRRANGDFIFGGFADSSGVTVGYVAALSQFGTPTTFGTGGHRIIHFGNNATEVNDLYIDASDRVVVTGDEGTYPNINGYVLRLTTTGDLDATFASSGVMMSDPGATTALFFRGVAETLDGGIVACGNFDGASQDLYVMLLNANGQLNGNFGGNGDVIIPFTINTNSVATMGCGVQSSGKIVLGGYLTSQDFVGENSFMIRVIPTAGLGVEEMTNEVLVNVYPNPVSNSFQVNTDGVEVVELLDVNGKSLKSWNAQASYELPVGVSTGVYIVRVKTEHSVGLARIMVK